MRKLSSRQVHLDFHTSELIGGIGTEFSKENFQAALIQGHVNSITIFAKCHHSWCYYPSMVGKMHPNLNYDLTGAMIDAAHEIGVKAPIYITAGWSSNDADLHPEWLALNYDQSPQLINYDLNASPDEIKPIVSWKVLCLNSQYRKHLLDLTQEICDRYSIVDGLFYDICFVNTKCYCKDCVDGMKSKGFNPNNKTENERYYIQERQLFMASCAKILRQKHPSATIFFNGGADQYRPEYHELQSHFELEDLPTTWGGYDKLPIRANYFSKTHKDYLGMTGKFHTMWGEFGGFKNPEALKFECATMLMYGARCSVGDQMHPCGEMDKGTYYTIGEAYRYVEAIEDYCFDAESTTKLGIVLSIPVKTDEDMTIENKSDEGLVKMLLENQLDFEIVVQPSDFYQYDTIIFPDSVRMTKDYASQVQSYINAGGSVLLTGESGMAINSDEFLIDIGAKYLKKSEFDCDYVQVNDTISEGVIKSPFLFYESAIQTEIADGEVLSVIYEPYFNRTYSHYSSHQNTPNKRTIATYPGAIRKNKVIYFAHKICSMYFVHGAQYHKQYFINALKLIYDKPVMDLNMPSAGRARFVDQTTQNRYILHLLYGSPIQRGRTLVIEDLPTLFDISVKLTVDKQIKKIYLAPQGILLEFKQTLNEVQFIVPSITMHQIVALDY